MKHERWGVIYCPTEGNRKRQRRWKRIRDYLEHSGQAFDFVQSDGADSVERLSGMFTLNGYDTIIVVGGDAALCEALNGMLKATPKGGEYPKLGVIPNGLINDFARYWGFRPSAPETTIDALQKGRTRLVDVGRVRLQTINGEIIERSFLNCVNVGLAASIIKLRRRAHSFWRGIGWLRELSSAFMLLLHRHSTRMTLHIGSGDYSQRITTLCIGSCTGYGQTPSAVPYNGLLDVSAVRRPELLQAFAALVLLFRRRFLSQKGISVWRAAAVEVKRIGRVAVSVDGRAIHRHITALSVDIRQEVIPFLIP